MNNNFKQDDVEMYFTKPILNMNIFKMFKKSKELKWFHQQPNQIELVEKHYKHKTDNDDYSLTEEMVQHIYLKEINNKNNYSKDEFLKLLENYRSFAWKNGLSLINKNKWIKQNL